MIKFTQNEIRVIACLIEKSLTTPDQYPLSINALTNACNQKTNRDPVLSLSEVEVQDTIDALSEKRLIMSQSGRTSRVAKYRHRFCNSEFSDLQFSEQELGIICLLFLRGPQTPGELRTRCNRLCSFKNVQETEEVLMEMGADKEAPYVTKLPRQVGRREARYAHCFSEQTENIVQNNDSEHEIDMVNKADRLDVLEDQIALMQLEIDELREKLDFLSK